MAMRREDYSERAPGRLVSFMGSIPAFVPDPLPRTMQLATMLSKKAERAGFLLGNLGVSGDLLNPWVHLFLRREAIASNRIEGTITTAEDLYAFEASVTEGASPASAEKEVHNYVRAMQHGIEALRERPFSLNLVRDMHRILMTGVRGEERRPGEFRVLQNAISPTRRVEDARFVPPPVPSMMEGLYDLEKFVHEDTEIPDLVRLALIHYQFETIHPFMDGNGRIGRLLIPLLLCAWGRLPSGPPRLYMSAYLESHDEEYRARLLRVSQNGEWCEWIGFFLDGVIEEAENTIKKVQDLTALRDSYRVKVKAKSPKLRDTMEALFKDSPAIYVRTVKQAAGVSRQQATNYVNDLVELGILTAGKAKYDRIFYAHEVFDVFFDRWALSRMAFNPPSEDAPPPEAPSPQAASPHAPPLPAEQSLPFED